MGMHNRPGSGRSARVALGAHSTYSHTNTEYCYFSVYFDLVCLLHVMRPHFLTYVKLSKCTPVLSLANQRI
jgi:hypothetical protein